MKVNIINLTGKKVGTIELPAQLFEVTPNTELLAQYVRVYQHNQRSAAAKTLSRSQVTGTTAKVWKQKGTGRARHGSRKAPIFVGGGKAHGPTGEQNYHLTLTRKMKRQALISALSTQAKAVVVIDNLSDLTGKTKQFAQFLSDAFNWNGKARFVVVADQTLPAANRAIGNLQQVTLTQAARLNAYEVLNTDHLLLTQDSIDTLKGLLQVEAVETKTNTKTSKKAV